MPIPPSTPVEVHHLARVLGFSPVMVLPAPWAHEGQRGRSRGHRVGSVTLPAVRVSIWVAYVSAPNKYLLGTSGPVRFS